MAYNMELLYIPDGTLAYEDGGAGGSFATIGIGSSVDYTTGYWSGVQAYAVSSEFDGLWKEAGPIPTDLTAAGWIAVRFKRTAGTSTAWLTHIGAHGGATDDRLSAVINSANAMSGNFSVDGAGSTYVAAGTVTNGTEHFGYVQWSGTAIGARLDGGALATGTRPTPDGVNGTNVYLGGVHTNITQLKLAFPLTGTISAVAIGTGTLTTGEIDSLQTATTPWVWNMELSDAPVVDAGADATITAGDTLTRTATFTDADSSSWTATVDYGEGAGPQAVTPGSGTVALSHTYASAGTYTVTVEVDDGDGGVGSDTATITVNPAPVTGYFTVVNVTGTDLSAPVITLGGA